jgi:arginine decarboxylase
VYADQRATEPGTEAWAGIGWVFRTDAAAGGLFVEHEGTSREDIQHSITASLEDLTAGRPQTFGPIQMQLASARCVDQPVCALVVASYETETWRRAPRELDLT